jgi:hypothetical protein
MKLLPSKDLVCTPKGQVQLIAGARSVLDFNQELAENWSAQRQKLWHPANRDGALDEVRRLAGVARLVDLPKPDVRRVGKLQRKGYTIEKLILELAAGIWLPALYFQPAQATGERILYVHGQGKHTDAGPDGAIEQLVLQGHPVLTFDLRGSGETGPGARHYELFTAYLLGKSFVGMRTEDVLVAARYLSELDSGKSAPVRLVAVGDAGPPALHAVALEGHLFSRATLKNSLKSWLPIVRDPTPAGALLHAVNGALRSYDLEDLLVVMRDKVSLE